MQQIDVIDEHSPALTSGKAGLRIAALMLGTFTVGLAEYVLMGQLDFVAQGLKTSEAAIGQLVTVFALAYGIVTPILVATLAKRSRRSVIVAGFLVFAATNLVSFFLPDYGTFVAARIVMAIAAGLIVVTCIASVSRVLPPSMTGRGIAIVQMGFTTSLILGVPLGRLFAEAVGWRWVFLVLAGLALISTAIIRLTLPPLPGVAGGRLADQLGHLRHRQVILGLIITLLWLGGYSLFYTYLTPYLLGPVGSSSLTVTLVLFVFGLASLVGTFFGGRHADRHSHRSALMIGKPLHVLALVALPLVSGSIWATTAVLILWSLSAWSSAAPQQMRIAAIKPGAADVLIGLNQSTMQLAIAAGAGLGGALIPAIGVNMLPFAAAVPVLISLLLLLLVSRRSA